MTKEYEIRKLVTENLKCEEMSSYRSEDSGIWNSDASGPRSSPLPFQSLENLESSQAGLKYSQNGGDSLGESADSFEDAKPFVDHEDAPGYSNGKWTREYVHRLGQVSTFSATLEPLGSEDPLDVRFSPGKIKTDAKRYQLHSRCFVTTGTQPSRIRTGSLLVTDIPGMSEHNWRTHSLPCLLPSSLTTDQTNNLPVHKIPHKVVKPPTQVSSACVMLSSQRLSAERNLLKEETTLNKRRSLNQCRTMEQRTSQEGKYGWIIVFAAFLVNMIIDGICLSFGVFYSELLDHFGQGQSKTAWAGSVLSGTYSLLGPLASGLSNRYGCRLVCICGSLISTCAFLLCIVSPNVEVLIVIYGFFGGLGFSLMYIPAIVMVSFYFDERRAFATGITVCGSGIGTFVFAPLTEYLLTVFDWKGAMIVVAGIVLHGTIAGALFRPLQQSNRPTNCEESYFSKPQAARENPHLRVSQYSLNITASNSSIKRQGSSSKDEYQKAKSSPYEEVHSTPLLAENSTGAQRRLRSQPGNHVNQWTWKSLDNIHDNDEATKDSLRVYASRVNEDCTLYRKDVFYSGSVYKLKDAFSADDDYEKKHCQESKLQPVQWKTKFQDFKESSSAAVNISTKQENKPTKIFRKMMDILGEMTNFYLFTDTLFLIYALSCTLTMFGFMVPFVYLPSCAREAGFSNHEGAALLSILGIANTIGRVCCGWVSDKRWISPIYINGFALVMTGIVTMVQPETVNFSLLAFTAFMFGIGVAVFISLRSVLMVDLIGLDKLTNGYGLISMCQGISLIIGPPIAGFLRDTTNSYRVPFCVAGAAILTAGILCFPLKYISHRRSLHLKQQTQSI